MPVYAKHARSACLYGLGGMQGMEGTIGEMPVNVALQHIVLSTVRPHMPAIVCIYSYMNIIE